jgi:hypothetical protein
MEPALACILSEKGVPLDIQDRFITEGVRSVSVFSHLADSPAELRQLLKDDYDLNLEQNAITLEARRTRRSNLAKVLDAWGAATIRVAEANKRDAERRADLYERVTLGVALERARKDLQLKERYFTTPLGSYALSSLRHFSALSISPSSRPTTAHRRVGNRPPKWKKVRNPWTKKVPQAKGKGKGKKKSKSKDSHKTMAREAPDGRKLCFAFNDASMGCGGGCGFLHACRQCFRQHPAHKCGQGRPPVPTVVQ